MNNLTGVLYSYEGGLDVAGESSLSMMFEDLYNYARVGNDQYLALGLRIAFYRLIDNNTEVVDEIIKAMIKDIRELSQELEQVKQELDKYVSTAGGA